MQTERKIHAHLVRVAPGLASAGCYGSMFFAVHFIAGRLPATQIIFTRAAVTSLVLLPSVIGKFRQITSRSALPLWLRSFAVEFSTVCFTWNLQHTSVGLANALYNLAPLFVLLAAWQIKTERRSFSRFISLLFVVSGGYVFWIGTSLHARVSAEVWVVGVTGAAAAAFAGIALKQAVVTWSPFAIAWSMSIAGIPEAIILKRGPWVIPDSYSAIILIEICLLGLTAQLLLAVSFKRLAASTASALTSSSIVWGVLFEVLQGGYPPPHGIAGCVLYLVGMTPLSMPGKSSKPAHGSRLARGAAESSSK